jgi:thiamine-phosphate pyrophosphorylase
MSTFSSLTPACARALNAAQGWACQQGALQVEPEHLLYALLEEEEGRPTQLLREAGLDLTGMRAQVPERPSELSQSAKLSFSAAAEKVLARAHEVAVESSHDRTVATEHLLCALLLEDQRVCDVLQTRGAAVNDLVARLLSLPGPPLRLDEPAHLARSTEDIDLARILDAGSNRAREALRVIEDYCRFVLEDQFLTRQVKELRHGLVEALEQLPGGIQVEARETLRDVGTQLSVASEQHRDSLVHVAQTNFKRLEEALRSLEEFSKIDCPAVAQRLKRLRYDCYTIERAVGLEAGSRERLADARLYVLLTASRCAAALDWTIKEAAAGGAQIFQLREKNLPDRELLERARQVRRFTRQEQVLFIMNDRPDLARLCEADGVHLGQEDLPVKDVRRIVGSDGLIGVSTHSLAQARQAVLDGASYIGVGPTFPSTTKEFADFPGLELVREVAAETSLPSFAIGGISLENVDLVVQAGVRRVAVASAVCEAKAPRQAAAALRRKLDGQ